jgi:hypothetical protein
MEKSTAEKKAKAETDLNELIDTLYGMKEEKDLAAKLAIVNFIKNTINKIKEYEERIKNEEKAAAKAEAQAGGKKSRKTRKSRKSRKTRKST